MKYISQSQIAKLFGYKNTKSFYSSSAHKQMMRGIEEIIRIVEEQNQYSLNKIIELATKLKE